MEKMELTSLSAMRWVGGKSAGKGNNTGTGKWINSMLPKNKILYAEPFAGMLGILLQREPSKFEIINDLDSQVVNWWRCVRDESQELSRLMELTPNSREEYDWAKNNVNNYELSPVRRALAFTILTQQTIIGNGGLSWSKTKRGGNRNWRRSLPEKIELLKDRIENIQIENKDAIDLLEELSRNEDSIIYCDPPYLNVRRIYNEDINLIKLKDVLLKQRGFVAISGYNNDYDCLGWNRYDYNTITVNGTLYNNKASSRTEVLWTNYDAEKYGAKFIG